MVLPYLAGKFTYQAMGYVCVFDCGRKIDLLFQGGLFAFNFLAAVNLILQARKNKLYDV